MTEKAISTDPYRLRIVIGSSLGRLYPTVTIGFDELATEAHDEGRARRCGRRERRQGRGGETLSSLAGHLR